MLYMYMDFCEIIENSCSWNFIPRIKSDLLGYEPCHLDVKHALEQSSKGTNKE